MKHRRSNLSNFDRYHTADWQDMGKRVQFLDEEGFERRVIYPTLGLFWEGEIDDPSLADAHCRAYNTWTFELCAPYHNRLYPAAYNPLSDPPLTVREKDE